MFCRRHHMRLHLITLAVVIFYRITADFQYTVAAYGGGFKTLSSTGEECRMPKNRIFVGVTLALLLAVASTLAFVGNSVSNSMAGVGADLNVPAANMQMAKNWQAKPGGSSVALPWANTRV